MQASRAIVQVLIESGVKHIFGLPGDTGVALYDALYDVTDQVTHVMTRDERSASFMADVYARASGTLGVCEGPSGGGATYIVPGVAEAHGSAIPLLCMTSDTPVSQRGQGVLTELDQAAMFQPVTKWSQRIDSPVTVADTLRRAIRLAVNGRSGAVHLSLPEDTLDGDTPDARVYGDPNAVNAPNMRTRPESALVDEVARLIEQAERPVVVAGGGVLASGASAALTAFAEGLNIPVVTSINGKGSVAETSRIAAGVVGGNGAWAYTNDLVNNADLLIFLGTRTDSTTTHHWKVPRPDSQPVAIQIDVEPWEIGNNYRLQVGLQGDARLAMVDLFDAIDDSQRVQNRNRSRIDALVAERDRYWADVERQAAQRTRPIKPQSVIRSLRENLGDDALIVADPGTPTPYLAAQYELRMGGRTTIIPRAHGGLGYAIPGVVGAAMACPDKRVVGMTGDGSFGMSCGELETITRLGLPVVMIQCSNGTYGWIKELQHLYHQDRYFSVEFNTVDYASIARGFGFQAAHVEDPEEVDSAIKTALADGRPYFLNLVTESQITETPPVAGWQETVAAGAAAERG